MYRTKSIITFVFLLLGARGPMLQAQIDPEIYKKEVFRVKELEEIVKRFEKDLKIKSDSIDLLTGQKGDLLLELDKLEKIKKTKSILERKDDTIKDLLKAKQSLADSFDRERIKIKGEYERKLKSDITNIRKEVLIFYERPFNTLMSLEISDFILEDINFFSKETNIDVTKLNDYLDYLRAKELLSKSFDSLNTSKYLSRLREIQEKNSDNGELKRLIGLIEDQEIIVEGLKQILLDLAQDEIVDGISEKMEIEKYNRIINRVMKFTYDYDFKHMDYPYYSLIIEEIIKTKRKNVDADLNYLLKRL